MCTCFSVLELFFKMGTLHVIQTSCIGALSSQRFLSAVDSAVLSPRICPECHRWVPPVPVDCYCVEFRVQVLISYYSVFQQPFDWKVVEKCYHMLYTVKESCKEICLSCLIVKMSSKLTEPCFLNAITSCSLSTPFIPWTVTAFADSWTGILFLLKKDISLGFMSLTSWS